MKKCICNHCDQHIEFDESMVGSEVICPSCGMDTMLYIPNKTITTPPTTITPPPIIASTKKMLTPSEKGVLAKHMYKFVVIKGGCCEYEYDIGKCEQISNRMAADGWLLVQVYQTTTPGCGSSKSSLVLIFQSG